MEKLGIVIIGRNSSATLPRVFDQVKYVLKQGFCSTPLVYVDSASDDESVQIAISKGIEVIQIAHGEWRCAAAGRNIGFYHLDSEYVLFLDGDMLLDSLWIQRSVTFLEENSNVALVSGERIDTDFNGEKVFTVKQRVNAITLSDRFSGACLVRRDVVNEIGGFDSFLISNEEKDLCDRILQKNYEIFILPHKMVTHLGPSIDFQERLRRGAMGYYLGIGQYCRKLISRGQYLKAFRKIRSQIIFVTFSIILFWLLFNGRISEVLFGLTSGVVITSYRFKSAKRGFLFIVSQPLILSGLLKGLFTYRNIADYRPKLKRFKPEKTS
jgi:glycosyltransferase involved in cell wall biosynthesis